MPLDDLKVKPDRWKHSQLFFEVRVAKEWGLTPSGYWQCSADDQALMAAFVVAESKMYEWTKQLRK